MSEYCVKFKNAIQKCDEDGYLPLNRWMRFVRNMVESTEINGVSDMQKALKYLNFVFSSMEDGDIIYYLSHLTSSLECTPFPQSQLKEEILKAQLIACDNNWEKSITEADNVTAWPGRSGYLMYFSGLSEKNIKILVNGTHRLIRSTGICLTPTKRRWICYYLILKALNSEQTVCLKERCCHKDVILGKKTIGVLSIL